jgi:UbiD family decarboxylase
LYKVIFIVIIHIVTEKGEYKMEDLRDWLAKVDSRGELKRLEGADWDLEISSILDPKVRGEDTSVLLFDSIKGYPKGYRIVCGPLHTTNRVADCLNLLEGSPVELVESLRHGLLQWETNLGNYPPKVVDTGPILENVHSGDDVNLFEFPAPRYHELDGGRYIGTGHAVITRDPDNGEVNLGTYRIMVHDEKTAGFFATPGHHGRIHYEKYHEAGQACPVAISIGHHPLIFAVSCNSLQGCEYNWAGAIRGEPIKVITEEVTGLPIPADSEIVIAGWCPPGKLRMEGPFGEWTGYYGSWESSAPIIEVERIYHRNNPIIHGVRNTRPPSENSLFRSIFTSAQLHNELAKSGIPDIRGVWRSEAVLDPFVVISIKQRYAGHAKKAALITSQSNALQVSRYVIVVDEDIDPTNIRDVVWALGFRSDPKSDIDIVRNSQSNSLDPLIRKPATAFFGSIAIIDACKPYDWIDEFPKAVEVSQELAAKYREKWKGLFHNRADRG